RCLQKETRQRLHDMGDARLELEDALSGAADAAVTTAAPAPAGWKQAIPWVVTAAVCVAAGFALWSRPGAVATPRNTARAVLPLAAKSNIVMGRGSSVVLAPDGRKLAYVATAGGTPQLYLRNLDQLESTPLPGTEGATNPFFSPD